jgi:hypothetical protein
MYTRSYQEVVNFLAEQAPDIDLSPGKVIQWAEPLCELLVFMFEKDYDDVTEDLYEAVREAQGIEDEEEDEDF